MRLLILATLALALTGCGDVPVYPVPVPPGPPPAPTPTPPPDNPPPVPTTNGTITQAQYDSLLEGDTEAQVIAKVGSPYSATIAAGFRILRYLFPSGHTVSVWVMDGKVAHKAVT